jgi:hypothetical protein
VRSKAAVTTASLVVEGARRWRAPADLWLTLGLRSACGVWVTRDGDLDDHVLQPGQRLAVRQGDWLTVEPWQRDTQLELGWSRRAGHGPRHALAGVAPLLQWAAQALHGASVALHAWARRVQAPA